MAASAANNTMPDVSEADYRKLISKALTRVSWKCCSISIASTPFNFCVLFYFFLLKSMQSVDMSVEMASESMEIITMSVDKHAALKNYEAAAQLIKTTMDKKFGAAWHCVIGEGFGFDCTYQAKNMVYVYYGTIGILAYKC